MVEHFEKTNHSMTLSFSDLSTWCYTCDAYVDNIVLNDVKNSASASKFGNAEVVNIKINYK